MPVDLAPLTDADDGLHPVGTEPDWNESRYLDFFDAAQGMAGWLRVGQRVNEGHAEVSVCLHLPDGGTAFGFARAPIDRAADGAGGVEFQVVQPFRRCGVQFDGELSLLPDAAALSDPRSAFRDNPRVPVSIDLIVHGRGLASVLGADQSHIGAIFLPGQAHAHYQHLVRSVGDIRLGDHRWTVDGRGARDQSWGPRRWHSKRWFRWLCAAIDDDSGFMLTRSEGCGEARVGGFMWEAGEPHWIDRIELQTTRDASLRQRSVEVCFYSGQREWRATGISQDTLPLRHRQRSAEGADTELRIVKAPTAWRFGDGRHAAGITEYHDLMEAGRPAGLAF